MASSGEVGNEAGRWGAEPATLAPLGKVDGKTVKPRFELGKVDGKAVKPGFELGTSLM